MKMSSLLAALGLLLASAGAQAVPTAFTYQGFLQDAGNPANGSYDLRFTLQSFDAMLGTQVVGTPQAKDDVAVSQGVFSVALDFGAAPSNANYTLKIEVRPGASTGAYTLLAPDTAITATPQAFYADASAFAVSVGPNSVGSPQIIDGNVVRSKIAGQAVSVTEIDASTVQARVAATCAAGSSIRAIDQSGAVTCETDDTGAGTITGVTAGTGLSGGGSSGAVSLAIAAGGVGSTQVNSAQVQLRVTGSCAVGSSIRTIAADGTVSCELDDVGSGWSLTGNAGLGAGNFLGSTDQSSVVLRAGNLAAFTITPVNNSTLAPNIVAGHASNTVSAGGNGQVIAGGGSAFTNCGPAGNGPCNNRISASRGTIGGGHGNEVVGSDGAIAGGSSNLVNQAATVAGGIGNQAFGTYGSVAGGSGNFAAGDHSSVLGGSNNTAAYFNATTVGGNANCAGGLLSVALGNRAKVRAPASALDANCTISSGDADGDNGSFAFADSQAADFVSTGPNQFLVRADGGVLFNTTSLPFSGDDVVIGARTASGDADADLRWRSRSGKSGVVYLSDTSGGFFWNAPNLVSGNAFLTTSNGASLSNGGTWTNASSRLLKTGFAGIDPSDVLRRLLTLPISTWNYVHSEEGRHLGPMAEDFKAAFDLAGDGRSIATVDADGVALAAIQGLNAKLEEALAATRQENQELKQRLERLEALLAR